MVSIRKRREKKGNQRLLRWTLGVGDLTQQAREHELDPVIGRQDGIERVIRASLCRRTKNNPVLLGEAGVGKTAIVEGLRQSVVQGNIPELLRDRSDCGLRPCNDGGWYKNTEASLKSVLRR